MKITYKIAGLAVGLSVAVAPVAFGQTADASTQNHQPMMGGQDMRNGMPMEPGAHMNQMRGHTESMAHGQHTPGSMPMQGGMHGAMNGAEHQELMQKHREEHQKLMAQQPMSGTR